MTTHTGGIKIDDTVYDEISADEKLQNRKAVAFCTNRACIKKFTAGLREVPIVKAKFTDTFCPYCGYALKWSKVHVTKITLIKYSYSLDEGVYFICYENEIDGKLGRYRHSYQQRKNESKSEWASTADGGKVKRSEL